MSVSPNIVDIAAITALCWTIFQQWQINQICRKCPYNPFNSVKN